MCVACSSQSPLWAPSVATGWMVRDVLILIFGGLIVATLLRALADGIDVETFERDGDAHLVKMCNPNLAGAFADLMSGRVLPSDEELKQTLRERSAQRFE